MMIVHNMGFLLLSNRTVATGPSGRMARKLPVQQDEDPGRNGENRQDRAEAADAQKRYQAPGNEEDGQQKHAYITGDMHMDSFPFEMGGRLAAEYLHPPPGRMRGKISGNMNRHIPGCSPAGGIPAAHGGRLGNAGRAIKPVDALPPDAGARLVL
jgi:hypothetical protein